MAITDAHGVYGAPQFHLAAKKLGIRALIGAEINGNHGARYTLLAENRAGYRNLCRLITRTKLREGGKGKAEGHFATEDDLVQHAEGLVCLTGGDEGALAQIYRRYKGPAAEERGLNLVRSLQRIFGGGSVFVELQRHFCRKQEARNQALVDLAHKVRLPLLATNGVAYATPEKRDLQDLLTCVKEKLPISEAGVLLNSNAERHMKTSEQMNKLFADVPEAVGNTYDLAERLQFTLKDLGYQFPRYPVPPGESEMSYLRQLTQIGARTRFQNYTAGEWRDKVQPQLQKELALIERRQLPGYFLIVWDVVDFCRREKILVQGRGSAANSAVCYALGITAIDPVRMELLFERSLSDERDEMPDIDLDLPSGDQRESVIQFVYRRYGQLGAAMTANVITYRGRSAVRDVGKALGFDEGHTTKLASQLNAFEWRDSKDQLEHRFREGGFDLQDPRTAKFFSLTNEIMGLPRHLGQHSGGMVVCQGELDSIVPLEPASMPGRVVVQWDKDDCADLGIIKIDLLGLGMMAVLEEAIPLVRAHEGVELDLAQLPADDPGVYRLLQTADTVGVFQVESRAQMATLPRMRPDHFYDIVVQVAIIRPGPIVGQMVNPYLERRAGRQKPSVPHPSLWAVLERTLGVPLFQEQLMRIAMVAANFTGGEADELRRAMGSKRSVDRMKRIEERLRAGMTANGISPSAQDEIVRDITSFALYGFPESHAASFALIVYASAYLKVHHPHAFYTAMLNCWPMGFYSPATLVKDAQRRGVRIKAIDVARSDWLCTLEREGPEEELRLRLGLRYARGLREGVGKRIVEERGRGPFASIADLAARAGLRRDELSALAEMGALASVPVRPGGELPTRRAALWQAEAAARRAGLFARVEPREDDIDDQGHVAVAVNDHVDVGVLAHVNAHPRVHAIRSLRAFGEEARASSVPAPAEVPADRARSPLPEMGLRDRIAADLRGTGMTVGPHPVALERDKLRAMGVHAAAELPQLRGGRIVRAGGLCIVRQRPGTAKGFVFLSLEDETGISNIVIDPPTFEANRLPILASSLLVVEGRLEKSDGVTSVKGHRFWGLREALAEHVQSRDFH